MGSSLVKCDKLKGQSNWPKFKKDMQAIFVRDGTWKVVSGKLAKLIPPSLLNKNGKLVEDSENKEDYKRLMKDFSDKSDTWEDKNN